MNRIFHARILLYQYFYLLFLALFTGITLWNQYIIPAASAMILLIVVIEKIIHTTYTITQEDELIVSQGRFSRKLIIPISQIEHIEKTNSMNFGKFHITDYVLIKYGEKYLAVMPVKEREFVEQLIKRRKLGQEEVKRKHRFKLK